MNHELGKQDPLLRGGLTPPAHEVLDAYGQEQVGTDARSDEIDLPPDLRGKLQSDVHGYLIFDSDGVGKEPDSSD